MYNGHVREVTEKLDLAKLAMSACVHPIRLAGWVQHTGGSRSKAELGPTGVRCVCTSKSVAVLHCFRSVSQNPT